ncbi:penicillin acylase family protein [Kordiimonas laminariae]|uniref:penicillin acylase family protein n=1 Tax=Kordiimonas laminariae TaxID=2917717 RepID=UPI001FF4A67C|nr:penicillin acylase family protein [Kordiimonas laminariae]MCK0069618.1 penicillin acylase family protein [Kordiimonas laminariae]
MSKLKFILITIIGLLITAGLFGYVWLTSSLPQTNGTIRIAGISEDVTIARDEHGVPHILGSSIDDINFAVGFVHAQDRLWQMEMNRRIAHGRVAEILGKEALPLDKFFRTLGFTERATSAWEALPADTKKHLEAYAAGVNAFLKQHSGALPPEFLLTGVTPEPWHPIDSIIWQKLMWLDLSGNMRHEIARARMLTKLSPEQVLSIYPTYPGDPEELPLPQITQAIADAGHFGIAEVIGAEKPAGYGSNNWVVDGSKTKSGKPLLANDPHLGLTTPSIWYLMRTHNTTTGKNVVGVGFPGSPYVVLGRNDTISWGFTNTYPDSQDLFIEKLLENGNYLTPTGPAEFVKRQEIIKVKGTEDVILEVRETRHGPVISDIRPNDKDFIDGDYVLALQWTALQETDTAVVALEKLSTAENFEEFKAAGKYYFGPEQNMIYADIEGNIGYYAPALVPVRHPENQINGRLPSPGWNPLYDWQGYLPFDELPTRYNPESGLIATANEKIVDKDYPYFITRDWSLPYRGNRIRDQLSQTDQHDAASFKRLHSDIVSDMARDILPHLLVLLDDESDVKNILAEWDGNMLTSEAGPLIFESWFRNYQRLLMSDDLGELYAPYSAQRPVLVKSSLFWGSGKTASDLNRAYFDIPVSSRDVSLAWCDDINTADITETCKVMANRAMETTIKELSERHGVDPVNWTWGKEHVLHQTHRPLSNVPQLRSMFEVASPIGGGRYTVNVSGISNNPASLNQSSFGASYRGIFDMNAPDRSLFVQPTGQSGNPFSNHYRDLFPLWRDVEYFEIPTSGFKQQAGKRVPESAKDVLTLESAN